MTGMEAVRARLEDRMQGQRWLLSRSLPPPVLPEYLSPRRGHQDLPKGYATPGGTGSVGPLRGGVSSVHRGSHLWEVGPCCASGGTWLGQAQASPASVRST